MKNLTVIRVTICVIALIFIVTTTTAFSPRSRNASSIKQNDCSCYECGYSGCCDKWECGTPEPCPTYIPTPEPCYECPTPELCPTPAPCECGTCPPPELCPTPAPCECGTCPDPGTCPPPELCPTPAPCECGTCPPPEPCPTPAPCECETCPPPRQGNPIFSKAIYQSSLPSWPIAGTTIRLGLNATTEDGSPIRYELLTSFEFLTLSSTQDIIFTSNVSDGAYVGPNNVMLIEVVASVIGNESRTSSSVIALVFPRSIIAEESPMILNETIS